MKTRSSNFELLRILSMVLIIGHHVSVHSGFFFHSSQVTGNMLYLQLLSIGGKIGVNLFVLISGYFLITADRIRWRKAAELWLQILFYSLVIYGLACVLGLTAFSWKALARAMMPVLSKQWWFASAYFVLYLLSPFLNARLGKVTQKGYRRLLILLLILWCGIPVLTWLPERLRDIAWFASLYCAAGYLRLYGKRDRPGFWLSLGILSFAGAFGYGVLRLHLMARNMPTYETAYFNMYEFQMLLTSLLLFRGVSAVEMKPNGKINRLAALSFGIYLIHDSDYLRYPLWREWTRSIAMIDSPWLIPYTLVLIAGVYLLCGLLEALRAKAMKAPAALLTRKLPQ